MDKEKPAMFCIAGFLFGRPLSWLTNHSVVLCSGFVRLLGFGVANVIQAIGRLVFAFMHLLRRVLGWLVLIGTGFAAAHS